MSGTHLFEIGEKVAVPTPRSALFRKRPVSQDRVTGKIVGRELPATQRGRSAPDWLYFIKIGWDEPWIEISQVDLLRLNPRNHAEESERT